MKKIIEYFRQIDFSISNIIKNVLKSYILSIILLIIFAAILTYSDFPESSIPTVVLIVSIVSILYASKLSANKVKNRGWLIGSITGFFYATILYLISLIFNQRAIFDMHVLFIFVISMLFGAIGGVIGINFKKTEKRYR